MPKSVAARRLTAGCVVYRGAGSQRRYLLLRAYDYWDFPKGRVEPGEEPLAAALREVEEETGLRCTLGRELPSARYEVNGRPKLVRYWLMAAEAERDFVPNDETDDLRWVTPDEARALLTYDRDRDVLAAL